MLHDCANLFYSPNSPLLFLRNVFLLMGERKTTFKSIITVTRKKECNRISTGQKSPRGLNTCYKRMHIYYSYAGVICLETTLLTWEVPREDTWGSSRVCIAAVVSPDSKCSSKPGFGEPRARRELLPYCLGLWESQVLWGWLLFIRDVSTVITAIANNKVGLLTMENFNCPFQVS